MDFPFPIKLAGLAVVAVPIILHLIHRGRRRHIQWGAMQFLTASVASRSRRIMLEEIILLTVRCTLLGAVALAMARPFLRSRAVVPWVVVLPAAFGTMLCLALGTAMWSDRRRRKTFYALALSLVAVAVVASLWESYQQHRRWDTGQARQDVAVVIDASMSMALDVERQQNFKRAVAEARQVVNATHAGDAVCLILAGPVPRRIIASPTADRAKVLDALKGLTDPVGGVADIPAAVGAAAAALADGKNLGKRVILITDRQRAGWDLDDAEQWRRVSVALEALPRQGRLICHTLPLPGSFRNAAVTDLALSRNIIGSDREVRVDATVLNTGSAVLEPAVVTLAVDGQVVSSRHMGRLRPNEPGLRPNEAETVSFNYRFRRSGPYVLTARVACKDDLAGDNAVSRVVNVIASLPALIVDGAPSNDPLGGGATFVSVALAPRKPGGGRTALTGGGSRHLVEPTVIPAPDIARVRTFDDYRLVVLANVSKLPRAVAGRLERFVAGGGGLLIAPGDQARADFYNQWKQQVSGKPVTPARLGERRSPPKGPVGLAPRSFTHAALALVADPDYFSDAATGAAIRTYWSLATDETDLDVSVGGRLDTGEPFLVERRIGKGRVLMTAMALDRHDSNLRTFEPFVAMVHEMAYFLAAPLSVDANVAPGTTVSLDLPLRGAASIQARATWAAPGEQMTVLTPSGRQRHAAVVAADDGRLRVDFTGADEVGLYRLVLGDDLAGQLDQRVSHPSLINQGWPFVVRATGVESRLDPLGDDELDQAAACGIDLFRAETADEVIAVVRGVVPGNDRLCLHLVIVALAAMLVEIALTRWIAIRRKSGRVEPIEFGRQDVDVQALRKLAGLDRRKSRAKKPSPGT